MGVVNIWQVRGIVFRIFFELQYYYCYIIIIIIIIIICCFTVVVAIIFIHTKFIQIDQKRQDCDMTSPSPAHSTTSTASPSLSCATEMPTKQISVAHSQGAVLSVQFCGRPLEIAASVSEGLGGSIHFLYDGEEEECVARVCCLF